MTAGDRKTACAKRPLLLRLLPGRVADSLWARLYLGKHGAWPSLYSDAELCYARGMRMELISGDIISDAIAFTGVYERVVTRRVAALAKRGGLFVDVGGNLGYFSLIWAAGNPVSRCLTVEASPRNIDILRRNVAKNHVEDRIEILPYAAGRINGKLHFDLGPIGETGWGGFASTAAAGTVQVDVVRLDDVVSSENTVELLKVDIEGADVWALQGCESLFKKRRVREVWFEQNKPRIRALGISEDAAQNYLDSVGYVAKPISDPSNDLVQWRAIPG